MFNALYLNRKPCQIIEVLKNGVNIGYWGSGIKEGEWIVKRVSKKDVTLNGSCE